MVIAKKGAADEGEQTWENPQNPEKPSDARNEEQILRQYKEAKRRKDNLTDEEDNNEQETKN
ncbi:hypothetical protein GCM10023149_18140 [Mucilaginibacter gynuensis]|uniref:Uncharacterized protein n=1 Tax=Mucilaginibacter gynuensis TaxID=1302236 RepID=A0ABP8G934_9SPHI